jgi:uncharacterized protein (DUF302 family)
VIVRRSESGYAETVARLRAAIERRELAILGRVDHAAGAREVGLELDDEEVFLFGNPVAGTPLMVSDPRVGIELPLRMLVWADATGVLVGYLDPRELAGTYDLAGHAETLGKMSALLGALAEEATT